MPLQFESHSLQLWLGSDAGDAAGRRCERIGDKFSESREARSIRRSPLRAVLRSSRHGLAVGMLLSTGCTRAPSFNIVGSFFPAWLVCLIVAVLLTVITGWSLLRLDVPVAVPALTYPALTASLTFALWLIFFAW